MLKRSLFSAFAVLAWGVPALASIYGKAVHSTNPVLPYEAADPGVLRVEESGKVLYYLVTTSHRGDIPLYRSENLVDWVQVGWAFGGTQPAHGSQRDKPLRLNTGYYCNIWAPELYRAPSGEFILTFSAKRTDSASVCPEHRDDSSVFVATSVSVKGPYAPSSRATEPRPVAPSAACAPAIAQNLPRSRWAPNATCEGGPCQDIPRLDSTYFEDPQTGKVWMGYTWYTSTPLANAPWERFNQGSHVSLIEMNRANPTEVKCASNNAPIFALNPQHQPTLDRMKAYCTGCGDFLNNAMNSSGGSYQKNGYTFAIGEAPALFRRGDYVYMLWSGGMWNSKAYHIAYTAARSVAELQYENMDRIIGRVVIPGANKSFGHATPVLGPLGDDDWYLLHHSMEDVSGCRSGRAGACDRALWVTKLEFEDRGDGKGDVYLKPRFLGAEKARIIVRTKP